MEELFIYLIKSALCLAAFYPFYMLLLSRETFHRFNRIALISILLVSLLIPVCQLTIKEPTLLSQTFQRWEKFITGTQEKNIYIDLTTDWDISISPVAELIPEETKHWTTEDITTFFTTNWKDIVFAIYIIGILFFLVRHTVSLLHMFRLLRKGIRRKLPDGNTLILHTKEKIAPFSWLRYIVVSEKDFKENGTEILAHEQAHINNRHSWDLLLIELCVLFQWFNPASWLLKQELQNIHEYEADESVIKQGIDAKQYQLLIIKKAVGTRLYSLANSLNHSSLKKRITMMLKEKSNPWARLKYIYVLPLAAISLIAFAHHPEVSTENNKISSDKVKELTPSVKADSTETPHFSMSKTAAKVKKHEEASSLQKEERVLSERITVVAKANPAITDKPTSLNYREAKVSAKKDSITPEKKQTSAIKEGEVFMVTEQMPQFPGGDSELMKYIQKNIKYPSVAQAANVEGRVVAQFIITKEGNIDNITISRSVSPELDAEAIRVIKGMPKWIPGKQRGKEVNVKYTLPVHFRLQKKEAKPQSNVETTNDSSDDVFMVVEDMPEFPGGMGELMNYLKQNVRYPAAAKEENVGGRVVAQFIVTEEGNIDNIVITRSISPELDEEAIRVIKAMPQWKPGRQRGKEVRVKYTLPIQFRLPPSTPINPEEEIKPSGISQKAIESLMERVPQNTVFYVGETVVKQDDLLLVLANKQVSRAQISLKNEGESKVKFLLD